MRYVIFRDDDTNALTPVACLERLYRPFLDRGWQVNLATIPNVSTSARMLDGKPEGFLRAAPANLNPTPTPFELVGQASGGKAGARTPSCMRFSGNGSADGGVRAHAVTGDLAESGQTPCSATGTCPIGSNPKLVRYLLENAGYRIVQHGCRHDCLEFDVPDRKALAGRLDEGTQHLREAGFPQPQTFVAPYDKLSRAGVIEVARRFSVLSTGWFELGRLPYAWWPRYALKKLRGTPHWRVGGTLLLSHPGCLLSYQRAYSTMLGGIIHHLASQRLTVLVTHWWEYFRDGQPDETFIEFLHETAAYIAGHPEIKVVSFEDLVGGKIPLN